MIMLKNPLQILYRKLLQKEQFTKTAEATADMNGNKIFDKITKISRTSPQTNSQTKTKEHDEEIPKERYISPQERQKVIDDLRLI